MIHVSISGTNLLPAESSLIWNSRANNYSSITQENAHVAVQINDPPQPQLQSVGRHAYKALTGGILGAVIGSAIGGVAAFLVSPNHQSDHGGTTVGVSLALVGAAAGAVMQVQRAKAIERNIHRLCNKVHSYCEQIGPAWEGERDHEQFIAWFEKMTDARECLEFRYRTQHVVDKLIEILDAASGNADLRGRLFEIAAFTVTGCHDRAAYGMKKMLDEIHDTEMRERGAGTDDFLARGKVAHNEFVLEQVAEHIATHPRTETGPFDRPDNFYKESLELYAYYAKHLGPELGLTNTVHHNRYAALFGFTSGYTLDEVRLMVRASADAEGGLRNFMLTWPSWVHHLEHVKPSWFQEIDALMLERHEEIEAMYEARQHAEPGPHNLRVMKETHLELAASERANSRRHLVEALTDHYFDTKDLDTFDFEAWMAKDRQRYTDEEQQFKNTPEKFAYLARSSAGALIGQH